MALNPTAQKLPLYAWFVERMQNIQLKDITTGKRVNAWEIFNYEASYLNLANFLRKNYIDPETRFVSPDGLHGIVYEDNKKQNLKRKRKKVPVYVNKVVKEYLPEYHEIKIGREIVIATSYKVVKKKKRILSHYEYQTIEYKGLHKRKFVYEFLEYVPFYLWEKYIVKDGKMRHFTYLQPFYAGNQIVRSFSMQNEKYEFIYSTPFEIQAKGIDEMALEYAQDEINNKKSETNLKRINKLWNKYKSVKKKDHRKGNYNYDERIIELTFYGNYNREGNRRVRELPLEE